MTSADVGPNPAPGPAGKSRRKEFIMTSRTALSPEQKEQTRHGGHLFPFQKYITSLSDLYPAVTPHWHDEAELTLITRGSCTYQIRFETYAAVEGDLLFVPPAALHSLTIPPKSRYDSETYVFHMNFLGANSADICAVRYLAPVAAQNLLLPCHIGRDHPAYSELIQIFHSINSVYEGAAPGYELVLKSLLLRVIAVLLPYGKEESSRPQLQTEHMDKLKLVLEYIGEHYAEDLSIAQLAKICFFSEYHFMRFFKKYMGTSCLEYVKDLRLEKAAELLSQGETPVLEASLSSGFPNLSYFYREFKKKYGMTPKQFIEAMPKEGINPHKFE